MKQDLSILPFRHVSGCFLGIRSWDFSEFCHKLETLMKLCMAARFFGKNVFAPKIGKMGQKWFFFFNLKRKLVFNFQWTCSKIKMLLFAVFLDQSYIWEKYCSWDIAKILSANQIAWFLNELFLENKLSKSGLRTLKFTLSQEWTDGINWFFACWYNFMQIKRWLKTLQVGMVKNRCG